jgi:hypothetical protein
MPPEAWDTVTGIGVALTTGLGAWAVARSSSSARASQQSAEAAQGAREERDLADPGGEARADVRAIRATVARIERRQELEAVARQKTSELLAEHLAYHTRAGRR